MARKDPAHGTHKTSEIAHQQASKPATSRILLYGVDSDIALKQAQNIVEALMHGNTKEIAEALDAAKGNSKAVAMAAREKMDELLGRVASNHKQFVTNARRHFGDIDKPDQRVSL